MALCPFAIQEPVSAHGGQIGTIVGVVIHVTAGEGDPFNEFANPANQVSSHFGIGNGQGGMADGQLEQYVDTEETAWAEVAGNAHYISVETEGEPTEALTAAQIATFGKLYAWLHQVHGVPFSITDTHGDAGFITHGDGGVAWGNHEDCPGPLRTPQRVAILNAANPPAPAPAPAPVPAPTSSPRGDTVLHTVTIPTDSNGDGYVETAIPWDTFCAISVEGSDPAPTADDRYFGATPGVQNRDGNVLAQVRGYVADSQCNVFIWATA